MKQFKLTISEHEIKQRVVALARQLEASSFGTVTVVAVTKGSLMFAVDLVRQMHPGPKVRLELLPASSFVGNKRARRPKLVRELLPKEAITGQQVVVLEDIVESGATLAAVLRTIKRYRPRSVKVVTLLARDGAPLPIGSEVGFWIRPGVFVKGYGLDNDQYERNLPFITEV